MKSYELIEATLADTRRLLSYRVQSNMEIHLNLKGFDYAWILDQVHWTRDLKVLDVGSGYSKLPVHIAKTYGCEVWAVDDFGMHEAGDFWERNQDPQAFIKGHPEIHYVIGRIGQNKLEEIPQQYFDVIYSASALEHVPVRHVESLWRHMDLLLKPGGNMLHGLDIAFPTSRGLRHVALAVMYDLFYPLIPRPIKERYIYETPKSYLRFLRKILPLSGISMSGNLNVLNMILNSDIVTEPLEHTYHRIVKDGLQEARYFRVGSLLLNLAKRG